MHFSLPILLALPQVPLALALPARTVVACLDFTGYRGRQGFSFDNGTYIALNYTVMASLRSATEPSNPFTLQEVCSYDSVLPQARIGLSLNCISGYTSSFLWGMMEVSYTTPTITSFIGADPAFFINATEKEDGSGTFSPEDLGVMGLMIQLQLFIIGAGSNSSPYGKGRIWYTNNLKGL